MHFTYLASLQLVSLNILEKYQIDAQEVFNRAGVDMALMKTEDGRYSLDEVYSLWSEMEKAIDDPSFPLVTANCWHPTYLGTLGHALLMSSSLRTTLERFVRFTQMVSDIPYGTLEEDKFNETLYFRVTPRDVLPRLASQTYSVLAFVISILRVNYQRKLIPTSVRSSYSRPACYDLFDTFFGLPVEFDAPVCEIGFSYVDVDYKLPSINPRLIELCDKEMTDYLLKRPFLSTKARVRYSIVHLLPSGELKIEQLANDLHLSVRTLQRLLRDEKTSFTDLLAEVRQDIAKTYLKNRSVSVNEIAFLLGFSEQSSFSAAFKRWTGLSPRTFRERQIGKKL